MAGDKPRLLIMTKTDLADPTTTAHWIDYFEQNGQPVLALDSRAHQVAKQVTVKAQQILKDQLAAERAKGMQKRAIRAMCVGVPNVGKSTLLNHLVKKKRCRAREPARGDDRPTMATFLGRLGTVRHPRGFMA